MVKVTRPPLCKTFELPTREELLKIKQGDFVKLIFNNKERMWVRVLSIEINKWTGTLANTPVSINAKFGQEIKFSPFDVIAIMTYDEMKVHGL